jgi:hypothetical protein
MFHIGLDLDNTLIDYSAVFGPIAVELGFLPPTFAMASKVEIRRRLLESPDGERQFMRLQGQVYGHYIGLASLYDGVRDFVARLSAMDVQFSIVSHRTRYGHFDDRRIDLRTAASAWLTAHGLVGAKGPVTPDRVFFETGRPEKLARIAERRCDIFIDDLADVLVDPAFPRGTKPFWFAPEGLPSDMRGLSPYRSWPELSQACVAGALRHQEAGL